MRGMNASTLLMLAGGAAVAYYLWNQTSAQAAPLSIYPEYAYTQTQTTSMATNAKQKVPAVPTGLYAVAQGANQTAMYTQCAGSYPGCTPMMSDTQLGF